MQPANFPVGFGPREGVFDEMQEGKRACRESTYPEGEVTSLAEAEAGLTALVQNCVQAYAYASQVCTNVEQSDPKVNANRHFTTHKKGLECVCEQLQEILQQMQNPEATITSVVHTYRDTLGGLNAWLHRFELQLCVVLQNHYKI